MSRLELLLASACALVLAAVWVYPVSLDPANTVIDGGDPLHLAWVMAWDAHQLVRAPARLFDSNTFYPYRQSLAFGDHLFPEALLVAPINLLTGNAVLASNVALLTGLGGAALAMYVLLRRVTGSPAAGAVAAACWAFNSFTHSELARVQVMQLQWWPLALLALVHVVESPAPRALRLFVAFVVLQGLASSYYMAYSALVAPLWLFVAYRSAERRPDRLEIRALAVALLAALPVVLPLTWPYLAGESRSWREKDLARGVDLLAYVTPPGRVVPGWDTTVPGFDNAFAGYLTLALAAFALWRYRRWTRAAWMLAACAGVTVAAGLLLSLGPELTVAGRALGRGPYHWLVAAVPLFKAMDGTQRAIVLVTLGTAILAGLGAQWLPARAAILVVPLLVAQHWRTPATAYAVPTGSSVPAVYRALAHEEGPVVELPLYAPEDRRFWSAYLYFSTYHWRPIVFGRTSFYPPAHELLAEWMSDFPSETSVTLLQRLGVRTVVVHPHGWPVEERAERLAALDAQPALEPVAQFPPLPDPRFGWLALGDERVYRLGPAPPATRPCEPSDPVPPDALQITGRTRPASSSRTVRNRWRFDYASDGDLRTSFATERPQMPGDVLDVRLATPVRVAAVTLSMGRRYGEFPRDLALLGEEASGTTVWLRSPDGPDVAWADLQTFLDGSDARLTRRLNPRTLRRVQLLLRGAEEGALPEWSVAEVRLWQDCR